MQTEYMQRKEVEAMLGLSCSAIYRNMREGTLPAPVKISGNAVRWRRSEIEAWLARLPRAHGESAEADTQGAGSYALRVEKGTLEAAAIEAILIDREIEGWIVENHGPQGGHPLNAGVGESGRIIFDEHS